MFNVIMINPQLFATEVQTTLLPALAPEVKTFYDKNLIEEASAALVHDQFGQKRPIPKNGGKTIEFRKFASLPKALTPLTEGVTPDGKNLNVTAITAEVAQYGDYVVMSDVLDLTAIDSVGVETSNLLGNQMGLTLDTVTRNEIVQGNQVIYAPKADGTEVTSRAALTAECKLTGELVAKAATQLKKMNAPKIDGKYICIIHPSVAFDLRMDPDWLNAHQYSATTELFNGEIGELHGVRFVESTEAKVWNEGKNGCAVYACLFLGKGAYGVVDLSEGTEVIVKPRGSSGTADPLDQRSSVGWKGIHAAAILYDEYMVRVECGSSYSATDKAN
jgi:N4-gp56 family major capsid protein